MRIIVNGALGRMGSEVIAAIERGFGDARLAGAADSFSAGESLSCGVKTARALVDIEESADCVIDFSDARATGEVCDFARSRAIPAVIASTGQTPDEIGMIHALSRSVPVFFSANMSLGAALLGDLVRRAAAVFSDADIEIVETHRAGKSDAPSGTALMLADQVIGVRPGANPVYGHTGHGKRKKDDIGIHSVRMGNAAGSHTVYIASDSQVLVLSHTVQSRSVFAEGALRAAEFLIGRTPGLYSVNDLLYGECGENGDKRG